MLHRSHLGALTVAGVAIAATVLGVSLYGGDDPATQGEQVAIEQNVPDEAGAEQTSGAVADTSLVQPAPSGAEPVLADKPAPTDTDKAASAAAGEPAATMPEAPGGAIQEAVTDAVQPLASSAAESIAAADEAARPAADVLADRAAEVAAAIDNVLAPAADGEAATAGDEIALAEAGAPVPTGPVAAVDKGPEAAPSAGGDGLLVGDPAAGPALVLAADLPAAADAIGSLAEAGGAVVDEAARSIEPKGDTSVEEPGQAAAGEGADGALSARMPADPAPAVLAQADQPADADATLAQGDPPADLEAEANAAAALAQAETNATAIEPAAGDATEVATAATSAPDAALVEPAAAPAADIDLPLKLSEIHFNTNSSYLSPGAKMMVDRAAAKLAELPGEFRVEIVGFSDTVGPERFNLWLAERRVNRVIDALVARGVDRDAMVAVPKGATNLPVPTGDEVPEPLNRCVAVKVVSLS